MATSEITVTAEQARTLTDRIKVAVDGTWLLIQEAYTSRAWSALGYASWDDYCTREFGTSRLRLPREERQEVVASLREIGMSVRAIATATGTNRETIRQEIAGDKKLSPAPAFRPPARHDLDDVLRESGIDPDELDDDDTDEVQPEHFASPAPVSRPITGTDGKQYHAAPARPSQKPRTDVVATVNRALQRAQDAARAADEVSRQHLVGRTTEAAAWARSLSSSLESLQRLHDLLKETQ